MIVENFFLFLAVFFGIMSFVLQCGETRSAALVSGATDYARSGERYERSGERLEGDRKGELRVSGARIGSGCKHKMGISDLHRAVFYKSIE